MYCMSFKISTKVSGTIFPSTVLPHNTMTGLKHTSLAYFSSACKYCMAADWSSSFRAHRRENYEFLLHTSLSAHPTGLTSSSLHSLLYTMRHQSNLSDEQGGTWCGLRSDAPPPRDYTPQICSMPDSSYNRDSPARFHTLEITLTHRSLFKIRPALTHTVHLQATDTKEGKGGRFSEDWGARRRPRALIFTSPTMILCNWWHKWPSAARLFSPHPSAPIDSRLFDLLSSLPCFYFYQILPCSKQVCKQNETQQVLIQNAMHVRNEQQTFTTREDTMEGSSCLSASPFVSCWQITTVNMQMVSCFFHL